MPRLIDCFDAMPFRDTYSWKSSTCPVPSSGLEVEDKNKEPKRLRCRTIGKEEKDRINDMVIRTSEKHQKCNPA